MQLPWRGAVKAAFSSPLTMIVAAVTALIACFLATAAVLHASAAGGATAHHQSGIVCPDEYGPMFTAHLAKPAAIPAVNEAIAKRAAQHGFSAPVTGMYTPVMQSQYGGADYRTRLAYRDGGLDQLKQVSGDRAPGIWMGETLSTATHTGVGTVGTFLGQAMPPVTGTYQDLTRPEPRWWCSQQPWALENRVDDHVKTGSVLFTTDRATFDNAMRDLDIAVLDQVVITFYEPAPRSLAAAEDLTERSRAMVADVRADLGDLVYGSLPFERSLAIAHQTEHNVLVSILPLAAISVLVGCAGIGTVALQWYQRRHARLRLLASRGSAPVSLGGLAAIELGPAIVLGAIAGGLLARSLLGVYGPDGDVGGEAITLGFALSACVLVLSLVLLVGVVAVRAHREFELARVRGSGKITRVLRLFPWELATAAMAVVSWNRMVGYGGASKLGDPLPAIDPLALTYPVFVVLTAGLVAARLVWLLLHASHRARFWSRPALQLAIRRLASARAPVTGVLVISTLAIGMLAAGTSIATGQQEALQTKAGFFVGGNVRVDTESAVGLGTKPLPAPLRDTSTVVGRIGDAGGVVLVIDPVTFARSAEFGALPRDEVDALIAKLDGAPNAPVPAIRVGPPSTLPPLPDSAIIGHLPGFPILGTQVGYVISRTELSKSKLADIGRWSIVSTVSQESAFAALDAVGIGRLDSVSKSGALNALPFYVIEWTVEFLTLLGAVLGVVAVLALLVAVETRRRQNALAGALVLRMGMRLRALLGSHLIELGALVTLAAVTGVACGVTVAGLSLPRLDPATFLSPRSQLPDPTGFVASVLVISACVVALAGWLAVRSVRTARTAELIRA
ncbi:ABC transporter permease [Amycolatopsis sp. cg5]|uniref:ABC transporter permease n=1 Tax=Amycolatopsis sp. cg5 TaxID=3238802 RepID=UPI003526329F